MTRSPLRVIERLAADLKSVEPHRILDYVVDKVARAVGPRLTSNLRIFRFDPLAARHRSPENLELTEFERAQDLPPDLEAQISDVGLDSEFAKNFAQGGRLWLGLIDGKIAVSLWTSGRANLAQWHIPIDPHDVIVYSVVTQPQFRGRGLTGAASAEIWRRIGDVNKAFYVDCKVWNRSAQRAFVKAGFRYVTTVPPHN